MAAKRCLACHHPIASFGPRFRAGVHVCGSCMKIARHDPFEIACRSRQEGLTRGDIDYLRMRVRSAVRVAVVLRNSRRQLALPRS